MTHTAHKLVALLTLFAAPALPASAQSPAQSTSTNYQTLLDEKAPLTVTIKFVLKMKGSFGEFENDEEATGVLISADGLILASNTRLGDSPFMRRGDATVTPTDIKILFDDDTEGVDATIIARDTDLDLAWLKIKEPQREYPFLDLKNDAEPKIGDELYTVSRMGKYFDRVPVVRAGRVAGRAAKPRPLIIPDGLGLALGLPVYDANHKFVGIPVVQRPDAEEADAGTGGVGMILPAETVARATARAKALLEMEEEE